MEGLALHVHTLLRDEDESCDVAVAAARRVCSVNSDNGHISAFSLHSRCGHRSWVGIGPPNARECARHVGIQNHQATESTFREQLPRGRRNFSIMHRTWGSQTRRLAAQAMLLTCVCLLWGYGGGATFDTDGRCSDIDGRCDVPSNEYQRMEQFSRRILPGEKEAAALNRARMRLADTFEVRKQLSGKSTYPHRYRSDSSSTRQCCGGDNCTECQREQVANIEAVRFSLESEIRILKILGCPCYIEKIVPLLGYVEGGTDVILTVVGLDIDKAFARGPLNCWIRMGLEEYVVRPTTRVLGQPNQLSCQTPPQITMQGPVMESQITLHGPDFEVAAGRIKFLYVERFSNLRLFSVQPSGAPSSPGGLPLTLTGSGFKDTIDQQLQIYCAYEGIFFAAEVRPRYGPAWEVVYNPSIQYNITVQCSDNITEQCLAGNITAQCSAVNCSCSISGVSSTISPWNIDCGCGCQAAKETAVCISPVGLPVGTGKMFISLNLLDPANQDFIDFAVYDQPRILGIWPNEGLENQPILIYTSGLGYTYQPFQGDIRCLFRQHHQEKVVPAMYITNANTISCVVPNNTRDDHLISGEVRVEISIIGEQRTMYTDHGESLSNVYTYRCQDSNILYSTILSFFPNCTLGRCCAPGYMSDGRHCIACPAGKYSAAGAYTCTSCPQYSISAPASPSHRSCRCKDGYTGSTNGIIATPWETCVACDTGKYSYISPKTETETRYSRDTDPILPGIHNRGTFDTQSSCRSCPAFATAREKSKFAADCRCLAGYMCFAKGFTPTIEDAKVQLYKPLPNTIGGQENWIPCTERLSRAFFAFGQRMCTANLREELRREVLDADPDIFVTDARDFSWPLPEFPQAAVAWTVSSSESVCGGGGLGNSSRYKSYSVEYNGAGYNNINFTCNEFLPARYKPNRTLGLCEDVDECLIGTHSCNPKTFLDSMSQNVSWTRSIAPSSWTQPAEDELRCRNTLGSFACICSSGYEPRPPSAAPVYTAVNNFSRYYASYTSTVYTPGINISWCWNTNTSSPVSNTSCSIYTPEFMNTTAARIRGCQNPDVNCSCNAFCVASDPAACGCMCKANYCTRQNCSCSNGVPSGPSVCGCNCQVSECNTSQNCACSDIGVATGPEECGCKCKLNDCFRSECSCSALGIASGPENCGCSCPLFVTQGGLPFKCVDQDECSDFTHNCHPNATCTNTEGSYTCSCNRYLKGDGIVDCWDGEMECRPAMSLYVKTASGDACWAKLSNLTSASGGPASATYCDRHAGTTGKVFVRFFWLASQMWSEERQLIAGDGYHESAPDLSPGAIVRAILQGMQYVGKPAMIEYRVEGNDAWRPLTIEVRMYNDNLSYVSGSPSGIEFRGNSGRRLLQVSSGSQALCWVDGDSCVSAGTCYTMEGSCGDIGPTAQVDFNECILSVSPCHKDATCINLRGSYRCDCRAGFYGLGNGIGGTGTDCVMCPEGKFSSGGAAVCEDCPGYPLSTSPIGTSLSEECSCAAGYYAELKQANDTCKECPANSYCPGGHEIYSCPSNAISPALSSLITDCVCEKGFFGINGEDCVMCPRGSKCIGGWMTEICPAGTYSGAFSSACSPCPQNSSSSQGSGLCVCQTGYKALGVHTVLTNGTCYSNKCAPVRSQDACAAAGNFLALGGNVTANAMTLNGVAAPSEDQCVWNESAKSLEWVTGSSGICTPDRQCLCEGCGALQCEACAEGKFAAAGDTACTDCPANGMSVFPAGKVDDCTCNSGFYGDLSSCVKCPPNATSKPDSKSFNDCACKKGYYNYSGANGEMVCTACAPGTYKDEDKNSEFCLDCPAGKFSDTQAVTACTQCEELKSSPTGSTGVGACQCIVGYIANSGNCIDTNECVNSNSNSCNLSATCSNTVGSFTCLCNAGFSGDGKTCLACEPGYSCSGSATVQNVSGSVAFSTFPTPCLAGTYARAAVSNCTACPINSTSIDIAEFCYCVAGYVADNSAGSDKRKLVLETSLCSNEDECTANIHNCDKAASCTDTVGSFTCTCPSGLPGNGTICEQSCGDGVRSGTEECDDANAITGDGCENCKLIPGWNCSGSPSSASVCVNVDECTAGTHTCHVNGTCFDTVGSFMCGCKAQYFGDGVLCKSCPPYSVSPTNSSSECACNCPDGFRTSPFRACTSSPSDALPYSFDCLDNDECTDGTHSCSTRMKCTNNVGSFACSCRLGYVANITNETLGTFTCEELNECADGTNNCDRFAACYNNEGSFTCQCLRGYYDFMVNVTTNFTGINGSCRACPSAMYSDSEGSTSCALCPGNSSSLPSSSIRTNCTCNAGFAGTIGLNGTGQCVICKAGFFSGPGQVECCECPANATSLAGSTQARDCFCDAGFYGGFPGNASSDTEPANCKTGGLTCNQCPSDATSLQNKTYKADCFCRPGFYQVTECTKCDSCIPGHARVGCTGMSPGECQDVNECSATPGRTPADGINNCHANATCFNLNTNFECQCNENFYGNGTLCRPCPKFSTSGKQSTQISDCICDEGYDIGDSQSRIVDIEGVECSVSFEVRITTATNASSVPICWSKGIRSENNLSSQISLQLPGEYCDNNAGTRNDVWVRVQLAMGNISNDRLNSIGAATIGLNFVKGYVAPNQFSHVYKLDAPTTYFEWQNVQGYQDYRQYLFDRGLLHTLYENTFLPNSVLACNVIFPLHADLREGVLWNFWGNDGTPSNPKNARAWLGVRKCTATMPGCKMAEFYFLRVRAGKGTTIIPPFPDDADSLAKDSLAISDEVWIDTTDFPRDGLQHQVVVQVCSRPLRLRLWIDGVAKGTHALPQALSLQQSALTTGLDGQGGGSYGIVVASTQEVRNGMSKEVPTGESNVTWPGGSGALGSSLRIIVSTSWENCTGAVLDGDFVTSPLAELIIFCPPTSKADSAAKVWTDWYAMYQRTDHDHETGAEPGMEFDFAIGKENVATFTGIPRFGIPVRIEYYVSGPDSFRPSKLQLRFPNGMLRSGISNTSSYVTRGDLCWVDSDGQQFEQAALGCPFVGQSASATLFPPNFASNYIGILSSAGSNLVSVAAPDARRAHQHVSRQGTSKRKSAHKIDRLQSHGHEDELYE